MIEFAHSCDGNPWLDTSVMAHSEYEGDFLLPQLMGALASESRAAPVMHRCNTHQYKASVLQGCASILRAWKLRFSPL
jgi:hypothetical protein